MRHIGVVLCLLAFIQVLPAKSRKDVPPAPLPSIVINARKVFLTNGGGSDLAYDTFYSEMKNWGKYDKVCCFWGAHDFDVSPHYLFSLLGFTAF